MLSTRLDQSLRQKKGCPNTRADKVGNELRQEDSKARRLKDKAGLKGKAGGYVAVS